MEFLKFLSKERIIATSQDGNDSKTAQLCNLNENETMEYIQADSGALPCSSIRRGLEDTRKSNSSAHPQWYAAYLEKTLLFCTELCQNHQVILVEHVKKTGKKSNKLNVPVCNHVRYS